MRETIMRHQQSSPWGQPPRAIGGYPPDRAFGYAGPMPAGASVRRVRILIAREAYGGGDEGVEPDDEIETLDEDDRAASCRPLFPEPGRRIVVPWDKTRDLLGGQLAHPDRLRDGHQLGCRLQIYEALDDQPIEALAASVLGDAARASHLHWLTDALAARLALPATFR